MDREHVLHQISDYVLGLLPPDEQRAVERHAGACAACRGALQRERQIELAVRQTISVATQPGIARLNSLRPPVPRATAPQPLHLRLAPVMLIAVLFLLGLTLQATGGWPAASRPLPGLASTSAPTMTVTSTMTVAPTMTIAALPAGNTTTPATQPAPTPASDDYQRPSPTPVAALAPRATN